MSIGDRLNRWAARADRAIVALSPLARDLEKARAARAEMAAFIQGQAENAHRAYEAGELDKGAYDARLRELADVMDRAEGYDLGPEGRGQLTTITPGAWHWTGSPSRAESDLRPMDVVHAEALAANADRTDRDMHLAEMDDLAADERDAATLEFRSSGELWADGRPVGTWLPEGGAGPTGPEIDALIEEEEARQAAFWGGEGPEWEAMAAAAAPDAGEAPAPAPSELTEQDAEADAIEVTRPDGDRFVTRHADLDWARRCYPEADGWSCQPVTGQHDAQIEAGQ